MLAREAERAKQPLQRAPRRAARRVFLWPEEVADLLQRGVNLTQLPGIGPYLNRMILQWLEETSEPPEPPEIRKDFLTLASIRSIHEQHIGSFATVQGDLQMHTTWSDGSASVQEMAEAAVSRLLVYRYHRPCEGLEDCGRH